MSKREEGEEHVSAAGGVHVKLEDGGACGGHHVLVGEDHTLEEKESRIGRMPAKNLPWAALGALCLPQQDGRSRL